MSITGALIRSLLGFALFTAFTGSANAQIDDHLKCYKIKDPLNYKAVVNLVTQQFGTASGCQVKVKGAMLCTPVTKTVTQNNGPSANYDGQLLNDDRVCYKVKCPKVTLPSPTVIDQFGNRPISKLATKLVCTPADIL